MEKNPKKGISKETESISKGEVEMRTNFPVFMKLVIVLLVFAFLPFLLFSVLIAWGYDSSFQALLEESSLESGARELLISQFRDIEHDLRIKFGFFFLLFSGFLIMGVWLGSRFLVRPLTKFLEGVRRLAKGDFGAKVVVETNDEFALFADYFNQMVKQLETGQEREAWVSKMKTELLTLAAHQLRTPLTAIHWILEELDQGSYGALQEKQQEAVRKGNTSTKRAIHLINSLLDTTAIEEGRFHYEFRWGNFGSIVEKTIQGVRAAAESKQVLIDLQMTKTLPKVYIDEEKIRFALENILSNAVDYSQPHGRITVTVRRRKTSKKKEIIVSVQDTGIGMTKGEVSKLFMRFFRGAEAAQMHHIGSGLGLFITKNIIKSHGGEIWVVSEKEKGSTFTFTIPIAAEDTLQREPSEKFILGD